jgi:hypothetical protein
MPIGQFVDHLYRNWLLVGFSLSAPSPAALPLPLRGSLALLDRRQRTGVRGISERRRISWLKALLWYYNEHVRPVDDAIRNFLLNNPFTYRDKRLCGGAPVTGLLSLCAVCGIGAAANVGIASQPFEADRSWWLAGLGGAAIGVSVFIWRSRAAHPAGGSRARLPRSEQTRQL